MKAFAATGEQGVAKLLAATHAGMTTDEFEQAVIDWIGRARHPKTGRPVTEIVYQPMLELLAYLRANGFKTFIVSGGGIEFMRSWTERVDGIPPEQVVGSIGLTLAVIHIVGLNVAGVSVNPARSAGPALLVCGKALGQLWLLIVAPLIGAAIAGFLFRERLLSAVD